MQHVLLRRCGYLQKIIADAQPAAPEPFKFRPGEAVARKSADAVDNKRKIVQVLQPPRSRVAAYNMPAGMNLGAVRKAAAPLREVNETPIIARWEKGIGPFTTPRQPDERHKGNLRVFFYGPEYGRDIQKTICIKRTAMTPAAFETDAELDADGFKELLTEKKAPPVLWSYRNHFVSYTVQRAWALRGAWVAVPTKIGTDSLLALLQCILPLIGDLRQADDVLQLVNKPAMRMLVFTPIGKQATAFAAFERRSRRVRVSFYSGGIDEMVTLRELLFDLAGVDSVDFPAPTNDTDHVFFTQHGSFSLVADEDPFQAALSVDRPLPAGFNYRMNNAVLFGGKWARRSRRGDSKRSEEEKRRLDDEARQKSLDNALFNAGRASAPAATLTPAEVEARREQERKNAQNRRVLSRPSIPDQARLYTAAFDDNDWFRTSANSLCLYGNEYQKWVPSPLRAKDERPSWPVLRVRDTRVLDPLAAAPVALSFCLQPENNGVLKRYLAIQLSQEEAGRANSVILLAKALALDCCDGVFVAVLQPETDDADTAALLALCMPCCVENPRAGIFVGHQDWYRSPRTAQQYAEIMCFLHQLGIDDMLITKNEAGNLRVASWQPWYRCFTNAHLLMLMHSWPRGDTSAAERTAPWREAAAASRVVARPDISSLRGIAWRTWLDKQRLSTILKLPPENATAVYTEIAARQRVFATMCETNLL